MRFTKPEVNPQPAWGHPIMRGCVAAIPCGWFGGAGQNSPGEVEFDLIRKVQGDIQGSINAQHTVNGAGSAITPGASAAAVRYTPPTGDEYDWSPLGSGLTCAILMRTTTSGSGFHVHADKRGNDSSDGFEFFSFGQGRSVSFEIGDGSSEQNTGTNNDLVLNEVGMRVGVLDIQNSRLQLWVDGFLDEDDAYTIGTVDNNTDPIDIFAKTGTSDPDPEMNLVALWNRALSAGEIGQLWADPYLLFKPMLVDDGLGGLSEADLQTYFLAL